MDLLFVTDIFLSHLRVPQNGLLMHTRTLPQLISEKILTEDLPVLWYSRGHVRPRLRILLGEHERHEINLAESTVRNDTVIAHAIVFFIITTAERVRWKSNCEETRYIHEMFDSSPDTSFLDAIDIGSGNYS